MTIPPQTEIERKRTTWWAEHFKPGMPLDEVLELNEKLLSLCPMTQEEREQRARELEGVPEFVL
jgi:hypothetical protein